MVHGGCVETVLDELTAEVMKVNVGPQNLTAEITFKLKKPSHPSAQHANRPPTLPTRILQEDLSTLVCSTRRRGHWWPL